MFDAVRLSERTFENAEFAHTPGEPVVELIQEL